MATVLSSSVSQKNELGNALKELALNKRAKQTSAEKTVTTEKRGKKKLNTNKILEEHLTSDQCLDTLQTEVESFGEPVPELYPELSQNSLEEDQTEVSHTQKSEASQCVPSTTSENSQPKPSDMNDSQASSENSQNSIKQKRKATTPKKVRKFPVSVPESSEKPNDAKVGSWVQCSKPDCGKWRFLKGKVDPIDIPEKWVCRMNTDDLYNSCVASQEAFDSQDEDFDVVYSPYPAGAIVWARLAGYPWWPALMEDDPDYGCYYETKAGERVPVSYHVVFFDKDVSRAWVTNYSVREFSADDEPEDMGQVVMRKKSYKSQLDKATEQARQALLLPLEERLSVYGFEKRYAGPIGGKRKKTKRKRPDKEEELLPSSLESSEDVISSGTSYSSSQDKKEKKPKKKTTSIAAKKKTAKTEAASTQIVNETNNNDSITEKSLSKESSEKAKEKKKRAKKPIVVNNEAISDATHEPSAKENVDSQAISENASLKDLSKHFKTTIPPTEVATEDKDKKKAPKKPRKRKQTEGPATGGEGASIEKDEGVKTDVTEKRPVEKKPSKKKCKAQETVPTIDGLATTMHNTVEKKIKEKPVNSVKTKTLKKKAERVENGDIKAEVKSTTKTSTKPKVAPLSTKTADTSLPKLPQVYNDNKDASPPKSPPKAGETIKKLLPKLVKSSFKPPSKTKRTDTTEGKPRKMPKLVKPQFISPALSTKNTEDEKPPSPKVSPKVIVEHLEEPGSSQEECSEPIKKPRKKAVRRALDSDDEGTSQDEMDAELAKLDKDIEDMQRTMTHSGESKDDAEAEVDVDSLIGTDNSSCKLQSAREVVSGHDSPEF